MSLTETKVLDVHNGMVRISCPDDYHFSNTETEQRISGKRPSSSGRQTGCNRTRPSFQCRRTDKSGLHTITINVYGYKGFGTGTKSLRKQKNIQFLRYSNASWEQNELSSLNEKNRDKTLQILQCSRQSNECVERMVFFPSPP
jgi:hypothetical protein